MVGVVAEIELLHLHHQPAQVLGAEALALAQYPVVAQDLPDQIRALGDEHPLIAALGIEAGNRIIAADELRRLRAEVLAQTVIRQAARLLAKHAIDNVGQRFAAQLRTCLRDQLLVQRIGCERLLQQASEMAVQPVLGDAVTGITQ